MTNHIHLLLENTKIPLHRILQTFLSTYAGYCNKAYDRVGHLFQGRYVAKHVNNTPYCLELFYYIHNNPVAAKLTEKPEDYLWSSYSQYLNGSPFSWVTTEYLSDMILSRFSSYMDFFDCYAQRKIESEFCTFDESQILNIQSTKKVDAIDLSMLRHFTFKEICLIICELFGITYEKLSSVSRSRTLCQARGISAFYAHFYAGFTLKYIGIQFERNEKNFSRTMYKVIKDENLSTVLKRAEVDFKKAIAEKTARKIVL